MKHVIIWVVALAAIACGLLVCESHLLWKVQEMNLFLQTSLFFKEQMVVPAGMLTYVGTWFTQLFYYPWLGVTVLCGWWLVLLFLLRFRSSQSPPSNSAILVMQLIILPVIVLLLA